jgi:glutamyl-tRNA synthetase
MGLYEKALEDLRATGTLFACDCSRKKIQQLDSSGYYLGQCLDRRLSLDKAEVAWRVNTLESDFQTFTEYPDQKVSALIPQDTAFYVVRKKDRLPAYHLTSVVDDVHFGVDLVIRGKDLYSSTLAQLDLGKKLGYDHFSKITFMHHPLIKGEKQEKLSKSDGSTSVQFLRKEGKTLREIFGILGKSMGLKEEITSFDEFQQVQ